MSVVLGERAGFWKGLVWLAAAIVGMMLASLLISPRTASADSGDELSLLRDDPVGGLADVGIGSDGLPIAVAMVPTSKSGATGVGFVHCLDASCRRGTVHHVFDIPVHPNLFALGHLKIAVGGDGLAVAAYSYQSGSSLKVGVIKCRDVECSAGTAHEVLSATPVSQNGFSYGPPGVDADEAGRPIISFGYTLFDYDSGHSGKLLSLRCGDPACGSVSVNEHSDVGKQAGGTSDVILTSDGVPVIAYSTIDPDNEYRGSLYLGRCVDQACTSMTSTLVQSASERSASTADWPSSAPGSDLDLGLAPDGSPVLAYTEDHSLDALTESNAAWLARCSDTACSQVARHRVDDPGSYEIEGFDATGSVEEVAVAVDGQGRAVVSYRPRMLNELYERHALVVWSCTDVDCETTARREIDQSPSTGARPAATFAGRRLVIAMNGNSFFAGEQVPVFYSCGSLPCTGEPTVWDFVGPDDDGEGTGFTDTAESVFSADIEWLADSGITRGCNPPANDRFCPDDPVTRGQMAAFLNRALDLAPGADHFKDTHDSVFSSDIGALAAAGITRGCNPPANTMFCPDDSVTRGQMAAFLVRALEYTDDGGGDVFADDNHSVFESDIDRLGTAGVTRGCNPPANDRFCPDDSVTRGQMAAFLHRALDG